MKEERRANVEEALALFLEHVTAIDGTTKAHVTGADGRVISRDLDAPIDYPHYNQCILDGYAVRTKDADGRETCREGASLRVSSVVECDTCAPVHTGDALPPGADAVLPLEDAQEVDGAVMVLKDPLPGQWVWPTGAGIKKGHVVFRQGMVLKPTDIAMLLKLGISKVPVYRKPRVLIIPTGDELVPPGGELTPGRVFESNGAMCAALVKRYGGTPFLQEIVKDDRTALKTALNGGSRYDLVVTIGGSSASRRDLMAEVASASGKLIFHGVSLHPGNHMGAGAIVTEKGSVPLLFLPGYTESCAVAAFVFMEAAVRKLGNHPPTLYGRDRAMLDHKVSTSLGVRAVRKVCVAEQKATPVPLLAGSSLQGRYAYVVVPEDASDFEEGAEVDCIYLE